MTGGKFYFFSRPRRFGKSLTLSTIREIYQCNKTLFKGLWIENNWDWSKQKPVIHISFSSIGYKTLGLVNALEIMLDKLATENNITLEATTYDQKLKEVIQKLSAENKVVILIDEYDKPLIDYLDDLDQAKTHQKVLKSFYSVLKDSDAYIEFLLITGVSKFSKVSVFSDLNNLRDITISRDSNKLVGYAEEEIRSYFGDYIEAVLQEHDFTKEVLFEKIKHWYNGYSWDAKQYVYNPFSVLCYFAERSFRNFWFTTGTPTFLINLLRRDFFYDMENVEVDESVFESYSLDNMDLRSLLFQTGYLTVKKVDEFGIYTLSYPNNEVRESMFRHLIGGFRHEAASNLNTDGYPLAQSIL